MVWAGVLAIVLMPCTPAYNQTYSYIDSNGTIHIENLRLNKPAEGRQNNNSRLLSRRKGPGSLATGAAQDGAEAGPGGVSCSMDKRGVLQIANVTAASEDNLHLIQQAALRAPATEGRSRKAVGKTQHRANGPQGLPKGNIQVCRDGQGHISITNRPAVDSQVASGGPLQRQAPQVDLASARTEPNAGAAVVPGEFKGDNRPAPVEITDSDSRLALYVDENGNMHLGQARFEASEASGWEDKGLAGRGATGLETIAAVADQADNLPFLQQVLPMAGAPERRGRQLAAVARRVADRFQVLPAGGIDVCRDSRGYLHIASSPTAGPGMSAAEPLVPEIQQAACSAESSLPVQSVSASTALLEQPGNAMPLVLARSNVSSTPDALPSRVGGKSRGGRVVFFKDKQGKLHIGNPQIEAPASPRFDHKTFAGNTGADLEMLMVLAARQHRLPVSLVKAVIKAESGFVLEAVSCKGAMGLMQLMPATADMLGVSDPFCPQENIMAGCRYLRTLLDSVNGSVALGLAAYNAGLQRVINAGYQVPAITETQNFVDRVIRYYFTFQQQGTSAPKI